VNVQFIRECGNAFRQAAPVVFWMTNDAKKPPGISFDVTFRVFTRNLCGNQE